MKFLTIRFKLALRFFFVWHSAISGFRHYVQQLQYACLVALRQPLFRLLFRYYHRHMFFDNTIHKNVSSKTILPIMLCLDSTHSKNMYTCTQCGNASVQPWLGSWEGQTERLWQNAKLVCLAVTYMKLIAAARSAVCVVVFAIIFVVINTICIQQQQ